MEEAVKFEELKGDDYLGRLKQQIGVFVGKVGKEFAHLDKVTSFITYVPDANPAVLSEDQKSAEMLGHFLSLAGVSVNFLAITTLTSFQEQLAMHADPNLVVVCSSRFADAVEHTPGLREAIDVFGRRRPDSLHTLLFEGGFADTALKVVDGHYLIRVCHRLRSQHSLQVHEGLIDVLLHLSGTNGLGLLPDLLNLEKDTRAKERSYYSQHFASLQELQQNLTVAYHLQQGLKEAIQEDPLLDYADEAGDNVEVQRIAEAILAHARVKVGLLFCKTSADTASASLVLKRWLMKKGLKIISVACVEFPGHPFKTAHQSVEDTLSNKIKLQRLDIDTLRQSQEQVVILFQDYDKTNSYDNLYVKNQLRSWKNLKVIFTCTADFFSHRSYENCFLPDPTNPNSEHLSTHVLAPLASQKSRDFVLSPAWQTFVDSKKIAQTTTEQGMQHLITTPKLQAQRAEFDSFLAERRRVFIAAGLQQEAMANNSCVFISYAWAAAGEARVRQQGLLRRIVHDLNTLGLPAWLDIERMTGDIDTQMIRNIRDSSFALVLDTALYRERMVLPTNVRKEYETITSKLALIGTFRVFALRYEEKCSLMPLPFESLDFSKIDEGEEYINQMNILITKLLNLREEHLDSYRQATGVLQKQLALVPGKYLLVDKGQDLIQALDIDQRLMGYLTPSALLRQGDPLSTRFDVETDFKNFLEQKTSKTYVVLGSSGSGKSLFTLCTFKRWLQEWHGWREGKGSQPQYLPIYIPLRNYANDLAEDCLALVLHEYGLASVDIENLKNGLGCHQQVLFILDGYDELGGAQPNYPQKLVSWPMARVLISCRPEGVEDDLQNLFGTEQQSSFVVRYLSPFSPEEIVQYVRHFDEKNAEVNHRTLQELPGMMPLLENPFLLNLTLQALPRLSASRSGTKQPVKRSHVYQAFIETIFNKESFKRKETFSQASYHAFAQDLAFALFKARETRISPEGQRDIWNQFFEAPSQLALREACPLKRSDKEYSFIHKSVYEYFVACHLWSMLGEHQEVRNRDWGIRSLLEERAVVTFLSEFYENHRPFGWVSGNVESNIQDEKTSDQTLPLRDIISASRHNPAGTLAAAGAVTVLNEAQVPFSGWDFQNTHLVGADLSFSVLAHADLSGANLRGATLTHAVLYGANLRDADLREVDWGQYPVFQIEQERGPQIKRYGNETVACPPLALHPFDPWMAVAQCKQQQPSDESKMSDIVFIDYETLQTVGDPIKVEGDVTCLTFSPNGKCLASASNKTVRLWNTQTRRQIGNSMIGHPAPVWSLDFNSDGTLLVSAQDGFSGEKIRVWDCETQTVRVLLEGTAPALFFAGDSGLQIATRAPDIMRRDLQFFDLATQTKTEFRGVQSYFALSPDGTLLVTGGEHLQFWDIKNMVELGSYPLGKNASNPNVNFSPDGSLVVAGAGNMVHILDSKTRMLIGNRLTINGRIAVVRFSADGKRVIAIDSKFNVHQWSLNSQLTVRKLHPANQCSDEISWIGINLQGTLAVSCSSFKVCFWDMKTQRLLSQHTPLPPIERVEFSPDGKEVVLASACGALHFWDAVTHTPLCEPVQAGKVTLAGLWVEGSRNAIGDMSIGEEVNDLTFSPDGKLLLSAQNDGVKLWNMTTHTKIGHMKHLNQVKASCFSPDGRQFVAADKNILRLWDVDTRTQIGADMCSTYPTYCNVAFVSFTRDGTKIISVATQYDNQNDEFRVWDVATTSFLSSSWDGLKPISMRLLSPKASCDLRVYNSGAESVVVFHWPCAARVAQCGNDFVVADRCGCISFWRAGQEGIQLRGMPTHADMPILPVGTQLMNCKMHPNAKRMIEYYGGDVDLVNID